MEKKIVHVEKSIIIRLKIKAFFQGKYGSKKDPSNEIAQHLDKNDIFLNDSGEEKKYSLNSCYEFGKDTQ